MIHFWEVMGQQAPYFLGVLLGGAVMTVEVTIGALFIALTLGLVVALLRISRLLPLRVIATIYVELMRGTPALAQPFIIYFGLPDIGIESSPVSAAVAHLEKARHAWR